MFQRERKYSVRLLCGAAAGVLSMFSTIAHAEALAPIEISAQPLAQALGEFASQTKRSVLVTPDLTAARVSRPVSGATDPEAALMVMLAGTDLTYRRDGDTFLIVKVAQDPQSGSAAGDGADGTVEALIVTAQKREENIQDVPIAISAFSQKDLEEQKIEGGFDLLKAIPNVTFSKNNFTSYNFSIRGIGTKAVSATTDPGVAVSFNNVALIQNRLFEQEYFDIERVEVLRGPQGTLYGRNATAGVINVISAKPDMNEFKGWVKGEVGNYQTKRISAMVNIPFVEDKLALRISGAMTDREGYDFNLLTGNPVNGRDLWSTRATLEFRPNDRFQAELVWERFNEDDNRSRTGKQLCHRDNGPTQIGGQVIGEGASELLQLLSRASFTPGCAPGSLYDKNAFGTPNGLALPFVYTLLQYTYGFTPIGYETPWVVDGQVDFNARPVTVIDLADPYGGLEQSHNLREIASIRDPIYRAKADVVQLNMTFDINDTLTLYSQTLYDKDTTYSFQDFNRFNTQPIINDTSTFFSPRTGDYTEENPSPRSQYASLAPGGQFCDPQLGCTDRMVAFDIAQAEAKQFTQELRLQSDYDGPLNFSVGANYTKFDVEADYYVFNNLITATSLALFLFNNQPDYTKCGVTKSFYFPLPYGTFYFPGEANPPMSMEDPDIGCPYIDPNPIGSLNGEGHNYYRSKNPYHLKSWAGFGEAYWQVNDALKVTAGLRYTKDEKRFTPYPTQVLMTGAIFVFGTVNRGLVASPDMNQEWGEWTGRLGFDWKPELSFTDDTMLYAFYSRGYKGGGANPPRVGFAPGLVPYLPKDYDDVFDPEFVNAFEVGSKNTLLGGALRLNAGAFYYDYEGYQVSKVVDRSIANENFDATVWGLELETFFAPNEHFQLIGNIGYLNTEIADGERSIDVFNRTQSNPNYVLVKPFVTFPSNCVAPLNVVKNIMGDIGYLTSVCQMVIPEFNGIPDPDLGGIYSPYNYPELNGGAGLYADIGGKELPNSPHWTANVGGQYVFDILEGWRATVRADAYWQSQSWARVYNAVNDKLHGWYNANLSLWIENDDGLKIELYAKNLLDKTPITDAFINSDDTALTTNVFVLDPRLIGLSIRKEF